MGPKTKHQVFIHLLQFFILGVLMGISEDLLAIHFATEAKTTWRVVKIAFLAALPFAIINELLIDLKVFRKILQKLKKENKKIELIPSFCYNLNRLSRLTKCRCII